MLDTFQNAVSLTRLIAKSLQRMLRTDGIAASLDGWNFSLTNLEGLDPGPYDFVRDLVGLAAALG